MWYPVFLGVLPSNFVAVCRPFPACARCEGFDGDETAVHYTECNDLWILQQSGYGVCVATVEILETIKERYRRHSSV